MIQTKKEESGEVEPEPYANPYELAMDSYKMEIERLCQKQGLPFSRFLSKKRCNQTKIVCKLLRHVLKLSKIEDYACDVEYFQKVQLHFQQMTQINDIRMLLID